MKMIFICILILALFLLGGCSSSSGDRTNTVNIAIEREGVAVFCDSTCYTSDLVTAWPDSLRTLIQEPVWNDARPGEQLNRYNVPKALNDNPQIHNYRYGVLSLGGIDIGRGEILAAVLDNYEDTLAVIASYGLEPVCLTYSYTTIVADRLNDFNDGVLVVCKGYKVITSTEQLIDGVHPTTAGSMETAENAWRVLY